MTRLGRSWAVAAAVAASVWLSGCSSAIVAMAYFQPARQTRPATLPPDTVEHRITTADGNAVQLFHCAYPGADRCVVFFHGTGGYAATRLPFGHALAHAARCDVVLAEYRGYGTSPGEPSEAGLYTDARASLAWTQNTLGHPPERTVVMGRSLGSGVACKVLGDGPYAGTVLLTPFLRGRDMADAFGFGALAWTIGYPFDSVSHLKRFREPVLIIHGTDDKVVPFAQGEALFAQANEPKTFHRVEGGTHNRVFPDAAAGYRLLAEFVDRCVPAGSGR